MRIGSVTALRSTAIIRMRACPCFSTYAPLSFYIVRPRRTAFTGVFNYATIIAFIRFFIAFSRIKYHSSVITFISFNRVNARIFTDFI